ncbi:MAG TPA: hypothetical protein VGM92_13060 [Candidatus Kapabacteria bacterium]|jgi:transcriptional regulator with XRE-family HTH domain
MDYRDTLHALVDELRHSEGLTWYQIAQRGRIKEQMLQEVLRKERNLSPNSLRRFLAGVGYEMHFERISSQTNSSR